MGKLPIQFLCFAFSISFLFNIIPVLSEEVENEREFDYQHPTRWGEIHPEWKLCASGTMQSPIDLTNERVTVVSNIGGLKRNYKPTNAILKNRGHDMMLQWDESGAGTLEINGTEYVLKQCHWHSPTEHSVNGTKYALEQHLVHESQDGKLAVIGIMYQLGEPDAFLSSLTEKLKAVAGAKEDTTAVGVVNPNDISLQCHSYYRYMGSLTVPPCTENVVWTVLKELKTVTKEQVELLRVAVHDESDTNARPTQNINGRRVQFFGHGRSN